MLKLNASYSKKVPAEAEYSSQQYHCQVEVELPDGLTQDQIQGRIHETFMMVRDSVEAELQTARQTAPAIQPPQMPPPQPPVMEAISSLKPELRTVMVLHYVDGLTVQNIADSLGIPLSTVKTRMRSARKRLKQKLLVEWEEEE